MSFNVPLHGFGNAGGLEESKEYPGCFYNTVDGVIEWLNPPNAVGTEYRTMARYKGKPVYEKSVNIGSMTSNRTVNTGISGISDVLEFNVIAIDSDDSSFQSVATCADLWVYLSSNGSTITIENEYEEEYAPSFTSMAHIKYIK